MSKYRAVATTVNGIKFHSLGESRRYQALELLQAAGEIHSLGLQVKYPLVVNGVKIADYVCDFEYFDVRKGAAVTEDYKGVRTAAYNLKKKLMLALYGITIYETGKDDL